MAERWGRVWTIGTWERVSKAHSRRAGEICCTHTSTLNHSGEKPGVVLGLRDKGQSTVSSNSLDPSGHQTSVLISSHHMLLTTPYTLSSSGWDALSSRTQKMLKIKHSTLMQWDFREEKHLKVIQEWWENEGNSLYHLIFSSAASAGIRNGFNSLIVWLKFLQSRFTNYFVICEGNTIWKTRFTQ